MERPPSSLTNQQRARIERNRQEALERKRISENARQTLQLPTEIRNFQVGVVRWCKVRIIDKGDITKFNGPNGSGHFFKFRVCDLSGEIDGISFNTNASRFYSIMEIGKVMNLRFVTVSRTHPNYAVKNREFEIRLNNISVGELCSDEEGRNFPEQYFDITKIKDIQSIEAGNFVDVVGICKNGGRFANVNVNGKLCMKRDITLLDDTLHEVNVTIWDEAAIGFIATDNPVIAIKGAKVNAFQGQNLTCVPSSILIRNPNIPRTADLKDWYGVHGMTSSFNNISNLCDRGVVGCVWEVLKKEEQQNDGV